MEMIECKWCNEKNPYRGPIDYFGYSGYRCQRCSRSVDESHQDWILREEWPNGAFRIEFASGLVRSTGSGAHREVPPTKVFRRSVEDALRNYPRVIMYPDSGGYTGIWISTSEARFFVFGRLFKHIRHVKDVDGILLAWKPIMDEILEKYKVLQREENRRGIHIDEIVDADTKERIEMLVGENV